jgi:hypothetical protein
MIDYLEVHKQLEEEFSAERAKILSEKIIREKSSIDETIKKEIAKAVSIGRQNISITKEHYNEIEKFEDAIRLSQYALGKAGFNFSKSNNKMSISWEDGAEIMSCDNCGEETYDEKELCDDCSECKNCCSCDKDEEEPIETNNTVGECEDECCEECGCDECECDDECECENDHDHNNEDFTEDDYDEDCLCEHCEEYRKTHNLNNNQNNNRN